MNNRFRQFVLAALFSGLCVASVPGYSQDAGWYAGVILGQSKARNTDCTGVATCDDTDTAWSIFGGYQVNANFGVQFGYADLGKVGASGTDPFLGAFSISYESTGFELSGVGTIPINERFSVYGKLGLFMWDLDAKATSSVFGSGSLSEDGTDLTYAIGAKYGFTKNFAVQLQWQRYNDIGNDATVGTSDIDVIGLGAIFRF